MLAMLKQLLMMTSILVGQALYLSDIQIGFDLEKNTQKVSICGSETSQIPPMLLKI